MALGSILTFQKVRKILIFKSDLLWFVLGWLKVVREPVETQSFARKTMHLNAVFQKSAFFGESTKCKLVFHPGGVLKFWRG